MLEFLHILESYKCEESGRVMRAPGTVSGLKDAGWLVAED